MCPEDPRSERDPETPPPAGKVVPFPSRRPDWLTDAGDDMEAVKEPATDLPREELEPRMPAPLSFRRPPLAGPARPVAPPATPGPAEVPAASQWAGPFSDMTRVPSAVPAGEAPSPAMSASRDSTAPAAAPTAWAPAASSVPLIRIPLPTEAPPASAKPATPPPAPVPLPVPVVVSPPVAPPGPALREPFWLVALDSVRSSRALQAGVLCGALGVVLLGAFLWPRGVGTVPIGRMRHEPTRYDGATVAVRGRVGDDVFAVGTGWAFYLVQGRDTIVAFSRNRSPRPHEIVTLRGQVSTGFLDGVARQALFETDSTGK